MKPAGKLQKSSGLRKLACATKKAWLSAVNERQEAKTKTIWEDDKEQLQLAQKELAARKDV